MLSGKLIHLIEAHHKEITNRIIREVWRHSDLERLRQIPEADLRERAHILLENLSYWLASENEEELATQQHAVGQLRWEQGVPIHEVLRALCVIKYNMFDYIEEQGIPRDPVGLYAEEELEHRIGRFFDVLMIHTVRGYETAWHRATANAAI